MLTRKGPWENTSVTSINVIESHEYFRIILLDGEYKLEETEIMLLSIYPKANVGERP